MKTLFIPIILIILLGCSKDDLNELNSNLNQKKILKKIVRSDGFVTHEYTYNKDDLLESFTLYNEFIDFKQVKTYFYSSDTIIQNEKKYLNGDLWHNRNIKKYPISNNISRTDYLLSGGGMSHFSIDYYGSCGIEEIETFWSDNKFRDRITMSYNNDCNKFKMEDLAGSINYIQEYTTDNKSRGDNKDLGIFHESIYNRNYGNIIYYNFYTETMNGRNVVQKNKYTYEYDDLDNPIKLTKELLHFDAVYTYTYEYY
jgi:hypothetical protein